MLLVASLASTISSGALLWTVVGGCFWGLGPLARKLGVSTTRSDAQLHERAALTALAYNLGNIITPAFDFFTTDAQSRQEVLSNADWQGALPQLILAAISSNIAGIVAVYALGRATRHTSCLVALVENGVYCVLSAVLIILLLHEIPHAVDYCAMALLTAGILLISSFSPPEAMAATPKKIDDDTNNDPQSDYGATHTGKDAYLDEANLMPYVYAILAGVLWSFGILGKRTSAGALPHGLERPGSAVTYMTYQLAGLPVVVLYWCYLSAFGNLPLHVTQDWFKAQGAKVLPLGMLSGIGGSLVTYAFAIGGKSGALLSLIADGMYTLIGAGLIAAVYGECPGVRQIIGGLCILVAVVVPQIH